MSKQRKQRQAAKERRHILRQQDDSTQFVVVKTTFTFPNGTILIGGYHIVEIPVSITHEQYRQQLLELPRLDYPEAQLSIEFYDIDDMPTDGSLPDGMTFRSAWRGEAL